MSSPWSKTQMWHQSFWTPSPLLRVHRRWPGSQRAHSGLGEAHRVGGVMQRASVESMCETTGKLNKKQNNNSRLGSGGWRVERAGGERGEGPRPGPSGWRGSGYLWFWTGQSRRVGFMWWWWWWWGLNKLGGRTGAAK